MIMYCGSMRIDAKATCVDERQTGTSRFCTSDAFGVMCGMESHKAQPGPECLLRLYGPIRHGNALGVVRVAVVEPFRWSPAWCACCRSDCRMTYSPTCAPLAYIQLVWPVSGVGVLVFGEAQRFSSARKLAGTLAS